jgi:hypothetical protein
MVQTDLQRIFGIFCSVDIPFINVPGGFAPAPVASPSEDISGKYSSHSTLAKVGYRNSTKPDIPEIFQ